VLLSVLCTTMLVSVQWCKCVVYNDAGSAAISVLCITMLVTTVLVKCTMVSVLCITVLVGV
jgi:hypothetical protein